MRLSGAEASWSLTEAANEPFFNLVLRYVFAPYFAGTLAMSAGQGASAWAFAVGAGGLAIALLAPLLGAIADSGARLKPWLGTVAVVAFLASASLWFAAPGGSLWPVAFAVFLGIVAVELMNQFSNAFLPMVTARDRMGLLSGLAFGFSQLAGIAVLLIMLWASRQPPAFLAAVPHGTDRLAGPLAAAAIVIFLLPFLLITPDRQPKPGQRPASVSRGLSELKDTLREAWADRDMRLFLIGRMFAADGMAVVFAFGAVLAAATFGWDSGSLAVFGLVITVFGAAGGFLAGLLDRRLGTKRLLLAGLLLLVLGAISVLATDATRLLGVPTGVALGVPLGSPQEQGFLASGAVIALGAAFALSAMRAMMAGLAPPEKIASYFGLFAFVGKATAFVGPFLVGVLARETGSLRPGIGIAVVFLSIGFAATLALRAPKAPVAGASASGHAASPPD